MTRIIENNSADQEFVEFSDDFGHWLAGFIAGEGSFVVTKMSREFGYVCRLVVQVRDDDSAILEEIQARTGLGYLCPHKPRGNINPGLTWNVSKKADVVALVDILDRFPLRAKKERDYLIWKQAVQEWGKAISGKKFDWSHMAVLKEKLQEGRKYDKL